MQTTAQGPSRRALHAVGVDIGATNTKLVLIDGTGAIRRRREARTPRGRDPHRLVAALATLARSFREESRSLGVIASIVGFTTPQFSDGPDWIQRHANNMPALEGFPLRPALAEGLRADPVVVYDSSAAAIAERLFGRGTDVQRLLTMSIGTGISVAMITEQGLVDFNWGGTGDSGQIIVDPGVTEGCSCGAVGCLEGIAAAPAIVRAATAAMERGETPQLADRARAHALSVADVVAAAADGDRVASTVLQRAGRSIGVALTSYIHMFRPDRIVICGGVARAGESLLRPIHDAVKHYTSPWYFSRLQGIVASAFPVDGAAIGAAAVALRTEVANAPMGAESIVGAGSVMEVRL